MNDLIIQFGIWNLEKELVNLIWFQRRRNSRYQNTIFWPDSVPPWMNLNNLLISGGDHARVLHVPEPDVDHEVGQLEDGVVLRLRLARSQHRVRPSESGLNNIQSLDRTHATYVFSLGMGKSTAHSSLQIVGLRWVSVVPCFCSANPTQRQA